MTPGELGFLMVTGGLAVLVVAVVVIGACRARGVWRKAWAGELRAAVGDCVAAAIALMAVFTIAPWPLPADWGDRPIVGGAQWFSTVAVLLSALSVVPLAMLLVSAVLAQGAALCAWLEHVPEGGHLARMVTWRLARIERAAVRSVLREYEGAPVTVVVTRRWGPDSALSEVVVPMSVDVTAVTAAMGGVGGVHGVRHEADTNTFTVEFDLAAVCSGVGGTAGSMTPKRAYRLGAPWWKAPSGGALTVRSSA